MFRAPKKEVATAGHGGGGGGGRIIVKIDRTAKRMMRRGAESCRGSETNEGQRERPGRGTRMQVIVKRDRTLRTLKCKNKRRFK